MLTILTLLNEIKKLIDEEAQQHTSDAYWDSATAAVAHGYGVCKEVEYLVDDIVEMFDIPRSKKLKDAVGYYYITGEDDELLKEVVGD